MIEHSYLPWISFLLTLLLDLQSMAEQKWKSRGTQSGLMLKRKVSSTEIGNSWVSTLRLQKHHASWYIVGVALKDKTAQQRRDVFFLLKLLLALLVNSMQKVVMLAPPAKQGYRPVVVLHCSQPAIKYCCQATNACLRIGRKSPRLL